jgi:hypothetical protein
MSDAPTLSVKPIITYPREAQVGKTYLMTIDLEVEENFKWRYDEEEYPIYCMVDSDLFSSKPVGEPVVVLHRFGGGYGEAKFLLTAGQIEKRGSIKIALINRWGMLVKNFSLGNIQLHESFHSSEPFSSPITSSAEELKISELQLDHTPEPESLLATAPTIELLTSEQKISIPHTSSD